MGTKGYETSRGERTVFGVYGIGLNIFFVLVNTFLQQYYLINAAVPAELVAVIFFIVKIWDGLNDPMFGVIVDRARLKGGKYLPWMRLSTFTLPLMVCLLFLVPVNMPVWVKGAWLLLGYMLTDAASTMTEVPYFAITTAMTGNPRERAQIIGTSRIIGTLPAFVVLFIPSLYAAIGWHLTVAIFAVFSMLTMLPGCFMLKERYSSRSEGVPELKDILRYLKSNKYLLLFFGSAILYGLANTSGGVTTLFAIYNLGGDEQITPLLIISFIPSILAIVAVKALINKFDKLHILLFTHLVTVITSALLYVTGWGNFALFAVLVALRGFSTGAHTALFFLFTPDFVEYGAYKTGVHAEGAAFSIQSFASKCINAISSASALLILGAFGFVEGSATQSAGVQEGIWLLFALVPVIGSLMQTGLLLGFYKLRDKQVAIMAQANHGEISRETAEGLLHGQARC
ncbi:MAG: MFS transporter [Treponema sp.]|nr:MFS transporter [Treponema sp.]